MNTVFLFFSPLKIYWETVQQQNAKLYQLQIKIAPAFAAI